MNNKFPSKEKGSTELGCTILGMAVVRQKKRDPFSRDERRESCAAQPASPRPACTLMAVAVEKAKK